MPGEALEPFGGRALAKHFVSLKAFAADSRSVNVRKSGRAAISGRPIKSHGTSQNFSLLHMMKIWQSRSDRTGLKGDTNAVRWSPSESTLARIASARAMGVTWKIWPCRHLRAPIGPSDQRGHPYLH